MTQYCLQRHFLEFSLDEDVEAAELNCGNPNLYTTSCASPKTSVQASACSRSFASPALLPVSQPLLSVSRPLLPLLTALLLQSLQPENLN